MNSLAHTPLTFNIFGIEISAYGIMIGIGITAGIFVAIWLGKKRGIKSDDIFTLALYAIPLAIVGARIYYVIFSDHIYTFVEIFQIWNGGIAILGAVIGGAIGVALYCLIHKKNFFKIADISAPALIIGQAIGRIGCYLNGCCYGIETTDPALQWFPISTQLDGVWHLSTFFYESFWCFLGFALLLFLFKKLHRTGALIFSYFVIYGVGRCIIETWRGDSLYLAGIKISQLLSGILVIVGIIGLVFIYTNVKKRKAKNEKNINP